MFEVSINDLEVRLPRTLGVDERSRAVALLGDAVEEIEDAITGSRYAPAAWLSVSRNRRRAVRVARAMVARAILVGEGAGQSSWSTGTGPYSESVTYSGDIKSPLLWGEVELTDDMAAYLGLGRGGPRGSFPPPPRWPEVTSR